MDQKPIACGNRLSSPSANYPWLVAQNLDAIEDQAFLGRIPELLGNRIRGHSHGWVILSNKKMKMWSLWNPVTSKTINLPPLNLSNSESVEQCCLSSPPDDPMSILLLTIIGKPTFVFCQLGFKIDRLSWRRMPYNRQLKEIIGHYNGFLQYPTSYNGKVYAMCKDADFVIQVDIIDKYGDALIKLLLHGRRPKPPSHTCFPMSIPLLKETCSGLFYIVVTFNEVTRETLGDVYLFKWAMTSMRWQKVVDIKDAVFFVDLTRDNFVYYNHKVLSGLGGYIHIRDEMGKMMYSYNVVDKTVSHSFMAYPTSHASSWECRLKGGHLSPHTFISQRVPDCVYKLLASLSPPRRFQTLYKSCIRDALAADDGVESGESPLLNLPFHLLEMVMDHCIGVEYMRLRATCKHCHLAAPSIQWSNKTMLSKLHNYSVLSPWLMVVDKNRDIITFTDSIFGDKYFMKRSISIYDERIRCSRFGWLLFCTAYTTLAFLNPFTGDMCKLTRCRYYLDSVSFSAPPTSHDCLVVGFSSGGGGYICMNFVAPEQTWVMIRLNFRCSGCLRFPTFHGRDLYALSDKGKVYVFENLFELHQGLSIKKVVSERCSQGEYFLAKRDQQLLLVIVGKLGEYVEVYKFDVDTKEWEKIECLGSYMLYICGATCLCIEAKAPEMENKIFFPRLDPKNGKVVFYSLETRMYHSFHGKHIEDIVGIGIKHVSPHVWIEPAWP